MNINALKENSSSNGLFVQSCTDSGRVRPHNEDFLGHFIPTNDAIKDKFGSLFIVSDGVGGNSAGEVASAEAVNVLLQEYYFGDYTEKIPDRLKDAYKFTALHIYDLAKSNPASCNNMMCTLTALLIRNDKFYIAHVGDSKAFMLRGGKFIQLTKDHTMVGKMVRLGFISAEAARTHPNKHVLLRALGERPILPADFYSGNVLPGDIFFLTSDGILEHLTEDEIQDFLTKKGHKNEGLKKLIDSANERGGYDNMSIMTIDTIGGI